LSPAVASLLALLLAVVLSFASRINVGLVSVPLAWAVGLYARQTTEAVLGGFLASLFVTLAGVTLLFAVAEVNGTMGRLAERLVGAARGSGRLVPPLVFLMAGLVSTIGPGAIASVALVVPLAMVIGREAGVPVFTTALMVANGANAGNLSPISAAGVIANTKIVEAGMGHHETKVWLANLIAHAVVSAAAYFILGGHRLPATPIARDAESVPQVELDRAHWITVAVIVAWIIGVVAFKLNVGFAAFAAAAIVVLAVALGLRVFTRQAPRIAEEL